MTTSRQRKTLVQMEIGIPVLLLILAIFAYLAWLFYGNYASGKYFSISDSLNFDLMLTMIFFAGVSATGFVLFFGAWAHAKMRYEETDRQKLKEEIKKELEAEKQKGTS